METIVKINNWNDFVTIMYKISVHLKDTRTYLTGGFSPESRDVISFEWQKYANGKISGVMFIGDYARYRVTKDTFDKDDGYIEIHKDGCMTIFDSLGYIMQFGVYSISRQRFFPDKVVLADWRVSELRRYIG